MVKNYKKTTIEIQSINLWHGNLFDLNLLYSKIAKGHY